MANSILNTIHKKITELTQKHPYLFLDFLADHIGNTNFQHFVRLLPKKPENITYGELATRLYMIVIKKNKGWQNILQYTLKYNADYIEKSGYHKLTKEELKKLFEKDEVPSLAGGGVVPEMVIMYLHYKRKFNDPLMTFLLEEYTKNEEKIKNAEVHVKGGINIPEKLKGTLFEQELQAFISEDISNPPAEEEYEKMAKDNGFEYIPEKKSFIVPRGLILFLFTKLEDIYNDKIVLDKLYRVLLKGLKDVNDYAKKLYVYYNKFKETFEENTKLKRELRLLKNKLTAYEKKHEHLENKLKETIDQDKDAMIVDLQKQLNYAYSRIEKLEERISELEEAKEINKEIKEDVEVKEAEEKERLQIDEGSFVVVSGGRWNSRTKEEAERLFAERGCIVEFVPAEDTLKKQDLIANADLVIFDTSKHAHKYYYKVKQLNSNIMFINKSNPEAFRQVL